MTETKLAAPARPARPLTADDRIAAAIRDHDLGKHDVHSPRECPICNPKHPIHEPDPSEPGISSKLRGAFERVMSRMVVDQPDPEPGEPVSPVDGLRMCSHCSGYRWVMDRTRDIHDPLYGRAEPCSHCSDVTAHSRLQQLLGGVPELMRPWTFATFPVHDQRAREFRDRMVEWVDDPAEPWAALTGRVSRGKTGLAWSAARELVVRGWGCVFVSMPDLLDAIRASYQPVDREDLRYEELMRRLREVRLLVLDDFGKERTNDWAVEKIFQLVDGRYKNKRRTIITSNLTLEGIAENLEDSAVSSRIRDAATARYCLNFDDLPYLRGGGQTPERRGSKGSRPAQRVLP